MYRERVHLPQLKTRTGPRLTQVLVEKLYDKLNTAPLDLRLIDALDAVTRGEWQDHEFTRVYVLLQTQADRDGLGDLVEFDLDPKVKWITRMGLVAATLRSIS